MAPSQSPPKFPPRRSSLSPTKRLNRATSQSPKRLPGISEAKDSLPSFKQTIKSDANLEREIRVIKEAIASGEGALKLRCSFDTPYWMRASETVSAKLKLNQLRQRQSIQHLQVTLNDFGETAEGLDLFNESHALELEQTLVQEQIRKQNIFHAESATLKSFVEGFISSPLRFNVTQICHGSKRDGTRRQQKFAKDLIRKQDSKHPDPALPYYWCPILGDWCQKAAMIAGHLVPWRCGSHGMRAIFGDDNTDAKGNTELFKADNGIYWSQIAEQRFSAGLFVIVPNVPEDPTTTSQMENWEQSSPRDYKILVLDPHHKLMTQKLNPYTSETWADKHNQRVQFRSESRPRTRYLYFAYCETLLKRSFVNNTLHYEIAKQESRKKYWGTPGRYVLKSALRGFIEVMGRDYSHILDGAISDDEPVGFAGVALAGKNIQDGVERRDPYRDGDDDDEDDDNDHDYDDYDDNNDEDDEEEEEEEEEDEG
ncbi:MAG: hypothetical protein Q9173_003865 [Seirophora scorigena]